MSKSPYTLPNLRKGSVLISLDGRLAVTILPDEEQENDKESDDDQGFLCKIEHRFENDTCFVRLTPIRLCQLLNANVHDFDESALKEWTVFGNNWMIVETSERGLRVIDFDDIAESQYFVGKEDFLKFVNRKSPEIISLHEIKPHSYFFPNCGGLISVSEIDSNGMIHCSFKNWRLILAKEFICASVNETPLLYDSSAIKLDACLFSKCSRSVIYKITELHDDKSVSFEVCDIYGKRIENEDSRLPVDSFLGVMNG